MATILGIFSVILSLAVAGFFLSFGIWLLRRYDVSFPIWLILSPLIATLIAQVFAEESSMLVFQMTDVNGISAEQVGVRLHVLRIVSALLDGVSKVLIASVGISEMIRILDQTDRKPEGFWRKFKMTKRTNIAFGILAVFTKALSTGLPGLYFHTL